MPRKKKTIEPIGVGYTSKQMKRKKPINNDFLIDIEALTDNQEKLFESYKNGQNIFAYGAAGTCLLYTSPSPRDRTRSRMPSSA